MLCSARDFLLLRDIHWSPLGGQASGLSPIYFDGSLVVSSRPCDALTTCPARNKKHLTRETKINIFGVPRYTHTHTWDDGRLFSSKLNFSYNLEDFVPFFYDAKQGGTDSVEAPLARLLQCEHSTKM